MVTREYFRSLCKEAFDAIDEALTCNYAAASAYEDGLLKCYSLCDVNPDAVRDELSRKYAGLIHQQWVKQNEADVKFIKVKRLMADEMSRNLSGIMVHFPSVNVEGVVSAIKTSTIYYENFDELGIEDAGIAIDFELMNGANDVCTFSLSYDDAAGCSVLFADLLYDLCDRRNWVPNAIGAMEYLHPTEKNYVLPVKKAE